MCNLCESGKFCSTCPRNDEVPGTLFQDAPIKREAFSSDPKIVVLPRKVLPRIEGQIFILEEKRFHIISNKEKDNRIKLCTKEGIIFYLRRVTKDENTYLSLIKQEPAFPRGTKVKHGNGDEILQIIPSLKGRNPSLLTEDFAW